MSRIIISLSKLYLKVFVLFQPIGNRLVTDVKVNVIYTLVSHYYQDHSLQQCVSLARARSLRLFSENYLCKRTLSLSFIQKACIQSLYYKLNKKKFTLEAFFFALKFLNESSCLVAVITGVLHTTVVEEWFLQAKFNKRKKFSILNYNRLSTIDTADKTEVTNKFVI